MRTYKLYLIRHGLTEGNLDGRYVGETDLDLCEEGAIELYQLKEEYEYPAVGKVYSSPLKRCIETARLLYPEITPTTVEDIREYSFGKFENHTPEELAEDPTYQKWLSSAQEIVPQGAEDMEAFKTRVIRGFHAIIMDMMKRQIGDAAVVTHGGVMMSFLTRCGLPRRSMMDWGVGSGRGYTLLVNASLWAGSQVVEVFTPLPYGTNKEIVMLDYQREMPDVDDGDFEGGGDDE